MAQAQIVTAQRDFSAGELDAEMKRQDDKPATRAGGRQMRDWRILNTNVAEQRPGRRAVYLQAGRVDQIEVAPGVIFDLCFGSDGSFVIRDSTGAIVGGNGTPGAYPWVLATIDRIIFTAVKVDVSRVDVIVTFLGIIPVVASYNAGVWTLGTFAFALDGSGASLAPFYRVAAPGATMTPNATLAATAAGSIVFSQPVLVADHIGALFRFAGRRLRIDTVVDSTHANVTAIDAFLQTQTLQCVAPDGALTTGIEGFSLGQVVRGSTSETEGEVVGINIGANQLTVQITNFASGFLASAVGPPAITELVIGPNAKSKVSVVANVAPLGAVSWDEQLMSLARGWPQSCFTDNGRLGFCDFPGTPDAVAWSATNQPYNFTVGAAATDAIVEVIAGKPRIFHVCPWTDELVFTNVGVFYIPINQTNPLAPGSIKFLPVSPEAGSTVKPAFANDGYLYVNAGRNRILAVIGTGSSLSTRPYVTRDISRLHTHLFAAGPKAIAIATGDDQFPEAHAYVTNADGSVVVGKFDPTQEWVGWLPWGGQGNVKWVSARLSVVRFVSVYPVLGIPDGVSVAEVVDKTVYLDAAVFFNAVPPQMGPPIGQGGMWWCKLANIELMIDHMPLGPHTVDGLGFVQPAYQGENLEIGAIRAGFRYDPTFEPFVPGAQPGQDAKQRMRRRSVARIAVTVKNSTGFKLATLHSGKVGPSLPAVGDIVKERRVPPWNDSDDQSVAPPLREDTYTFRPTGRSYDPRNAVIKDVPGPLQLIEVGMEVTV